MITWIKKVIQNKLRSLKYDIKYAQHIKYLKSIKGSEKGKVGFVIGNGPSLKMSDLDIIANLNNVVSIASNKIYLAYSETNWKADYFSIADPLVWEKCHTELYEHHDKAFLTNNLKPSADLNRVICLKHIKGVPISRDPDDTSLYFAEDISRGLHPGGTVTYENLQLAAHLGLNPVYIIGCDNSYAGSGENPKENSSNPVQHDAESENHFIKGYRKPGEVVLSANVILMNKAYEEARIFSDQSEIKIYNATRGGYLDAFERASLDDVLRQLASSSD